MGQTRVRDETGGSIGTIAYVGPVASAKDPSVLYAGIIWDDPHRGKHNGSVLCRKTKRIISYFVTSSPTGGSFVKMDKLDYGVALTRSVLRHKYVDLHSPECVAPENQLRNCYVHTTTDGHTKPIELHGEYQIRKYQQLSDVPTVSLRWSGIVDVQLETDEGDSTTKTTENPNPKMFDNVKELDLACNLFHSFGTVTKALPYFRNVEIFSIAGNRIVDWNMIPHTYPTNLMHLNLQQCSVHDLGVVLQIGESMPNLRQLVLANNPNLLENHNKNNNDTTNDQFQEKFDNLEYLDVSNCGLTSPTLFSKIPNLKTLNVNANLGITQFHVTDQDDPNRWFTKLESLHLEHTSVSEWKHFVVPPTLRSVRVKHVPLVQSCSVGAARCRILAHFPQLDTINSTVMTSVDRKEAARWCMQQSQLQQHPQYEYWKTQYPDIVTSLSPQQSSGSFTSSSSEPYPNHMSIITVTIRSMAPGSCEMPGLTRRFPKSMRISQLQALIARHFGLDIDLQVLSFVNSTTTEGSMPESIHSDDYDPIIGADRDLEYYNVPDGAEILVKEREILESTATAQPPLHTNNKHLQDLEQRIDAQERELADLERRKQQAHVTSIS